MEQDRNGMGNREKNKYYLLLAARKMITRKQGFQNRL